MNSQTLSSFRDELIKIAGVMDYLHTGWHGTEQSPQTWFGQGRQVKPVANAASATGRSQMGRFGRAAEEVTSLGGLTRALPVGNKSLMLLGTGVMAHQALQKQDPTGQERSRAERLSGLAGNTLGGLVGAGMAAKHFPGSRFIAPLVGGIGGSILGEKALSAPFRRQAPPAAGYQQQQPVYPEGVAQ